MAQQNGKYQTLTLFPALNICHFEDIMQNTAPHQLLERELTLSQSNPGQNIYGPYAAGATELTLQICTSKYEDSH